MSTIRIDDLDVIFPFPSAYPEQIEYMTQLKLSLDANGPCVLEMPSGTGKTASLLSLIIAYMEKNENTGPLVYCTRTIPEMNQGILELRRIHNIRKDMTNSEYDQNFLGISLSCRANLCINDENSEIQIKSDVDIACRRLTIEYAEKRCDFFDHVLLRPRPGIYGLAELKQFGIMNGICPFFLSRRLVKEANVILCSFAYTLDPGASEIIFKNLPATSIVVFDEAHNIDDVCCEFLSLNLTPIHLEKAAIALDSSQRLAETSRKAEEQKLNDAFAKLKEGLANQTEGFVSGETLDKIEHMTIPQNILEKAMPKSTITFLNEMRCIIQFFMGFIKGFAKPEGGIPVIDLGAERFSTTNVLKKIYAQAGIEPEQLKTAYLRFSSFLTSNKVVDFEHYSPLSDVIQFAGYLAMVDEGYTVFVENGAILRLSCVDPAIGFSNVSNTYKRIVVTSGTLSPLQIYPRLLNFQPVAVASFSMSLARRCLMPIIVSNGLMGAPLTSAFKHRSGPAVSQAYGDLLLRTCEIVPDGIVGFFPSYLYMNELFKSWVASGLIEKVLKHKLIFVETGTATETSFALDNYRKSCENGRGAVFLGVARGRVSEGIDFADHYGRCVIMFGLPVRNTQSVVVNARADYIESKYGIDRKEFMLFDAMRAASQCIGRLLRSKRDYGVIFLADKRYARPDVGTQLPHWIKEFMDWENEQIDTGTAIRRAAGFMLNMAQPYEYDESKLKVTSSVVNV